MLTSFSRKSHTVVETDNKEVVTQGCVLSQHCSTYTIRKYFFNESLSDFSIGVYINGKLINNIPYDDDNTI